MTEWKLITGSQAVRPAETDTSSSPTTVYLRRNIEQVTGVREESGETITEWQYEERQLTREEYTNMLLMRQVVGENTQDIVASVTEFQKEAVIDEYTRQLIEEGVI